MDFHIIYFMGSGVLPYCTLWYISEREHITATQLQHTVLISILITYLLFYLFVYDMVIGNITNFISYFNILSYWQAKLNILIKNAKILIISKYKNSIN